MQANIPHQLLFANMRRNAKPVAAMSRRFSRIDQELTAEEVESLLSKEVI